MPAALNGVKINEMMQGSALSSWDERLSGRAKSRNNSLTVSEEPLERLFLASEFEEETYPRWILFSQLEAPHLFFFPSGLNGFVLM